MQDRTPLIEPEPITSSKRKLSEDEPQEKRKKHKKRKKRKQKIDDFEAKITTLENVINVQSDDIERLSHVITTLKITLASQMGTNSANAEMIASQEEHIAIHIANREKLVKTIEELRATLKANTATLLADKEKIKNLTENFWFHHEGAMIATQHMFLENRRLVKHVEKLTAESKEDKQLIQHLREKTQEFIDVASPASDRSILSFASKQNSMWRLSPATAKQEAKEVADKPAEQEAQDRLPGFFL
jgi:uncharacterized coiled-coil protein SlyX